MGHGTIGEIQRTFRKLNMLMKMELSILENETEIKNILPRNSIKKIFYRKNMFYYFIKIKNIYYKKKLG